MNCNKRQGRLFSHFPEVIKLQRTFYYAILVRAKESAMQDHQIIYPITTVDIVVMTIEKEQLCVLLHRRAQEPCQGTWSLPGGWVRTNEDVSVEAAAHRVLRDKVGMPAYHLEQLAVFSSAKRDPRGWSLSVAHIALVPREQLVELNPEIDRLVPVGEAESIVTAFDHGQIIKAAAQRLRGKGVYSTLPASLLSEGFSLPRLREVYEIVTGSKIDMSSFRRKVLDLGFVEETGEKEILPGARKPSVLYRLSDKGRTFNRLLSSE
ncbi:NUDIX hydrolase [Epibacterium sp. DP7N7-1]|nr:NUDIX hydrolase [Epibacterium sp. DP7N7-1]